MPSGIAAAISGGTSLVGGILGSRSQKKAASSAAKAQEKAADKSAEAQLKAAKLGIAEQRRQFDRVQSILKPYTKAGAGALQAQQGLIGLRGPGVQEAAISGLAESPQFQALAQQGEEALLQQASATGGLRGGNIQGALAQFRPAMLQQLIESQYGKLGGLTQLGQASAAGVGSAGIQTGQGIANLYGQAGQGQAQAALIAGQGQSAAALARGQASANLFGDIGQLVTTGAILKGQGVF